MDFTDHNVEAVATGWFRIHGELDETSILPGSRSENIEEREQDRERDEGRGEEAHEVGILDSVEERMRPVQEGQVAEAGDVPGTPTV